MSQVAQNAPSDYAGAVAHDGAVSAAQSALEFWFHGNCAEALTVLEGHSDPISESVRVLVRTETGDPGRLGVEHEAQQPANDEARMYLALAKGRIANSLGDTEDALFSFDDAAARARQVGSSAIECRAHLDAAAVHLFRGAPGDASAAAGRLAEARALAEHAELHWPLRVLLARARGANGDWTGATLDARQLAAEAEAAERPRAHVAALLAYAEGEHSSGRETKARQLEQQAVEILDGMALRLPVKEREGFWGAPERRALRMRARLRPKERSAPSDGAKALRILDITKRLASEHDQERLLERITDAAVELAGAERGFVLLPDEAGVLEPKLVRAGASEDDPSVAFSRSIAEAVWIDGEPILTVDAHQDRRLSEYLSVHKLMLRSVASLPIRGRDGTLGVLYLEHRLRSGRFREADLELLMAFADLVAIALTNARLIESLEARERQIRLAKDEVEDAKRELERVLVARTDELAIARAELDRTREALRGRYDREGIVGKSESMRRVFAVLDRVRTNAIPVVIRGESGTGKELVARAIHFAGSRASESFVPMNCAAVPEPLLESELFGHVRGAFTGADRARRGVLEQAHGGTLFLDEVGDMPPKMQVDLLRVLQDGVVRPVGGGAEDEVNVDVRIISASNKSLPDLVESGAFREDLFYRLQVVGIDLPPLRERVDDLPLLADHFLARFAERDDAPRKRLTREALQRIADHPMPGNIRQLEHLLLNASVMVEGDTIEAADLALGDEVSATRRPLPAASVETEVPPQSLDDFKGAEKQKILAALEGNGWNRAKAARALDIPRRTFYRRLKEHGILQ
ncbi:MAG: serine/threonine-protein kinase PknK [Polyangiales bacterium]|jgi:serine/threonine-protein kinase PknK